MNDEKISGRKKSRCKRLRDVNKLGMLRVDGSSEQGRMTKVALGALTGDDRRVSFESVPWE